MSPGIEQSIKNQVKPRNYKINASLVSRIIPVVLFLHDNTQSDPVVKANNNPIVVFWFRRDLRLEDNKGLYQALKSGRKVLPLFIFDESVIDPLPGNDHRVSFIYQSLASMDESLQNNGGGLLIKRGKPLEVIRELLSDYPVEAVYCNMDHEPYGRKRDYEVAGLLNDHGIRFHTFWDHLLLHPEKVLKQDGTPYQVFTPYSNRWKQILQSGDLEYHASEKLLKHIMPEQSMPGPEQSSLFPDLTELGFTWSSLKTPSPKIDKDLIRAYDRLRDFPAAEGTSKLGVHLRFGTLGIRNLAKIAAELNEVFLGELIWREFYAMILWYYPAVVDQAFKPAYDRIEWRNNEKEFLAWKEGNTGYPMVDAGMRQLNQTGYMHNRLRMVTASFLTKHLLIDWRWGEAYFAEKLFDYELSSNNGGWQWCAGSGCDAAPYFRIFNPYSQQKKFDPQDEFVKKWVPEADSEDYVREIVAHKKARERCLQVYKRALEATSNKNGQ